MKKTIKYFLSCAGIGGLLLVGACSKKDELPAIDGFNNSNEVAASSLVAHWSFDSGQKEDISGTAPTTTFGTVASTSGQIGNGIQLTNGALVFPTITALSSASALPSVTVSLWAKIDNNATTQTNVFGITQALATQTDWNTGPLNVYIETANHKVVSDTLQLHSNFATYIGGTRYTGDNVNNYGTLGTDFLAFAPGKGKWFHYVMRYDGGGSLIDLFANGVKVSNNKFALRKYNPGSGDVNMGNINILPPTQVVIGSFANSGVGFTNSPLQTWQGKMTGGVDDIRVYKKSLTDAEIGSLFKLGTAGR